MGALLSRYPVTAALLGLSLLLLAVIGFETRWGTQLRPPLPGGGPVKTTVVEPKLLPPLTPSTPEQAYPETGARPLFTPTRRQAPQAAAATTMVKGQYTLHGVTIVAGLRIAMLKEKGSGRFVRAEMGRELNGVNVAEIEADRVVLRLGEDSETLSLTVQKGGAPAPAAAGAAGPFPGAPTTPAASPQALPRPVPAPGTPPAVPGAAGSPVAPRSAPGANTSSAPGGAATAIPVAASDAGASSGPLTPEELLARRRARRTQPGQQ